MCVCAHVTTNGRVHVLEQTFPTCEITHMIHRCRDKCILYYRTHACALVLVLHFFFSLHAPSPLPLSFVSRFSLCKDHHPARHLSWQTVVGRGRMFFVEWSTLLSTTQCVDAVPESWCLSFDGAVSSVFVPLYSHVCQCYFISTKSVLSRAFSVVKNGTTHVCQTLLRMSDHKQRSL